MSTEINLLIKFKHSIISFLDELIEQFPEEGDFVILRIFVKDQVPIERVMKQFIHKLLPLKDTIKDRDESFFLDNNVLFVSLEKGKVNHFRRMWRSPNLDEKDRDAMWKWFDLFVVYGEKYQKIKLVKSQN